MKPPPSIGGKRRGNGKKLPVDQKSTPTEKRKIKNRVAYLFVKYSGLGQSHASSDVLTQSVRVTHQMHLTKTTKINRFLRW